MSDLGPIQYEEDQGSVFLGRDYANMSKNFSTQVAYEIDKAVREIIDNAHEEAKKIILEHKDYVTLIAETLLEKETITAEEIEALVKTGKLPEKKKANVSESSVISAEEKAKLDNIASGPTKRDIENGAKSEPEEKSEDKPDDKTDPKA